MRLLAKFAMQGWWQTLLLTTLLAWLSIRFIPLSLLSASVGALYTLRKGLINGAVILVIAAFITWTISLFVETRPGLEIPVVLFIYLPVLLCTHVLLITESQGHCLLMAAACALFQAVFIQIASGDAVIWWSDWIKHAITGIQGATFTGFEKDGTLKLFNGLAAMMLAIVTFLSVLLGRSMQASQLNPGGCLREFCALQIPRYGLTLAILSALISYFFSPQLTYDVAIIATLIFGFQGLAVIHAIVINKGLKKIYLAPAYLFLIFSPQFALFGFALIGVFDVFFNFRKIPITINP